MYRRPLRLHLLELLGPSIGPNWIASGSSRSWEYSLFTLGAISGTQALPPTLGSMIATIDGAGAFGVDPFFVLSAYLIT